MNNSFSLVDASADLGSPVSNMGCGDGLYAGPTIPPASDSSVARRWAVGSEEILLGDVKAGFSFKDMNAVFFILIDEALLFASGLVESDLKTVLDEVATSGAVDGAVVDRVAVNGAVVDGAADAFVDDEVVVVIGAAIDEEVVVVVIVVDVIVFTEEPAIDKVFADAAFCVDGSVDSLSLVNEKVF
ncbi:hypothetical protein NDU88_005851 [Pleurodeles waltl]|uniref:Uncharacterized protein n=1 Tax=Pleurodeles waltl TaxID=8319 RepID=A0AAV7VL45_PLEWA|nr:hypothetical protein NDU88_005851 [Pleurodeles waltl]